MTRIAIVDYGMGNLHSVAQALRTAAPEARVNVVNTPADLRAADRIVLPGQGAMPDCMRTLEASGLKAALMQVARNKPMLGICIGEQMLFETSEEGPSPGLGLLPGRVVRFRGPAFQPGAPDGHWLKIPHVGWSGVHPTVAHPLWAGIDQGTPFYFVHSLYAVPDDPKQVAGTGRYGQTFCCAVAAENIFAVQFHPEKSARPGLRLYHNFAHWVP